MSLGLGERVLGDVRVPGSGVDRNLLCPGSLEVGTVLLLFFPERRPGQLLCWGPSPSCLSLCVERGTPAGVLGAELGWSGYRSVGWPWPCWAPW